jgi:hypothetical protein
MNEVLYSITYRKQVIKCVAVLWYIAELLYVSKLPCMHALWVEYRYYAVYNTATNLGCIALNINFQYQS